MPKEGTLLIYLFVFLKCLSHISASSNQYRDQFCVDPRTMKKHSAYTEWADAYSCTRHRCQPSGKALAMFTVGCQMVTVPEYAIECEEVIEDTNMQFPYCCIRLRCLVVVHGEVWTRLIGQPWENLPAAPWSHMYKMKKPPPVSDKIVKESLGGPVYQLGSSVPAGGEIRSEKRNGDILPRAIDKPDVRYERTTHCEHGDPEVVIEVDPKGKLDQMFDYNTKLLPKITMDSTLHNIMEQFESSPSTKLRAREHRQSEEMEQHIDNNEYKQSDDTKSQPEQEMNSINTWSSSSHSDLAKPLLPPGNQDLHNMVATMGDRMNTIEQVIHKISDAMDMIKTDNTKAKNAVIYHSPKITKLDSSLRGMRPSNNMSPIYRSMSADKKLTPVPKVRKLNSSLDPYQSNPETANPSGTHKSTAGDITSRRHPQDLEMRKGKEVKPLYKYRKGRTNSSDEIIYSHTKGKNKKTVNSEYVEIEDYGSNESVSDV